MIATLQSIDHLLNRFDELSQSHSNFLAEFDRKFTEFDNPLRHVTRTKDEQKQTTTTTTTTNLLLTIKENDPIGPLEDFHRRVLRSRVLHRPPNYSSPIPNIPSKSSFTTGDTLSTSRILFTKEQVHQPLQIRQKNSPIVSKNIQTTKKDLKNPSTRPPITTFSMETVNRLSQPKRYNRLPEPKPPVNTKKDLSKRPKPNPVVRSRPVNKRPVPSKVSSKSKSSTKKSFRF